MQCQKVLWATGKALSFLCQSPLPRHVNFLINFLKKVFGKMSYRSVLHHLSVVLLWHWVPPRCRRQQAKDAATFLFDHHCYPLKITANTGEKWQTNVRGKQTSNSFLRNGTTLKSINIYIELWNFFKTSIETLMMKAQIFQPGLWRLRPAWVQLWALWKEDVWYWTF